MFAQYCTIFRNLINMAANLVKMGSKQEMEFDIEVGLFKTGYLGHFKPDIGKGQGARLKK